MSTPRFLPRLTPSGSRRGVTGAGLGLLAFLSGAPHLARGADAPEATTGSHPSDAAWARLRASGILRWGGDEQGGEPYVFEDPGRPGHRIGFEVELADELAAEIAARARMPVRAEFVQNDWSTLIPSLERGSFEMAMNGIEVTPAWSGRVTFSRPYCMFSERLVARTGDSRISGLRGLRGLRSGTLAASQAWNMLLAVGAEAVPYEGVEEPLIDLESSRIDAVLLDDIIVDRYLPGHRRLRVVGDVGTGRYAIATRPADTTLAAAIDTALLELSRSGRLARILDRWHLAGHLPPDPGAPAPHPSAGAVATAGTTTPGADEAPGVALPRTRFGWHHLTLFLEATMITVLVSTGAMMLAVPLGLALALMRVYTRRARWFASAYVELFRGTPVLLQLYVLYYGLASVLRFNALGAAILGLGLNYAAYEAEIHRAGIAAVPRGQTEAALSLGMSRRLTIRRIVVPQALRVALPGIANDFIALLKDSSLVSVISVVELTKRMSIVAVDTRGWLVPGLACAALYLGLSFPLSRLARRLERRLGGGA